MNKSLFVALLILSLGMAKQSLAMQKDVAPRGGGLGYGGHSCRGRGHFHRHGGPGGDHRGPGGDHRGPGGDHRGPGGPVGPRMTPRGPRDFCEKVNDPAVHDLIVAVQAADVARMNAVIGAAATAGKLDMVLNQELRKTKKSFDLIK